MTRTLWSAAAAALLLTGTALAVTPAEKCTSDKNKEAAKYVACRQKAEAKFVLTAAGAARAGALQKCADKYDAKWPAIEGKAGGACPSRGDQGAIRHYLDTASGDVALALAGGILPGRGHRLKTGQTLCWYPFSSQPIPCAGTGKDGELQKGVDRLYVDNGDGTITDVRTGLMWEKLSDDGSIHDQDNTFTWTQALTYKVAGLNALAFAGHTDWRLPNVNELHSLAHYGATAYPAVSPVFTTGCVAGCSVLTCSCTWRVGFSGGYYWSSTAIDPYPSDAWEVAAYNGSVRYSVKTRLNHVRAVRGGS